MSRLKVIGSQSGRISALWNTFFFAETQQVLTVLFLSMVILWGQIEAEVLYSVDGIVYSLVAKELTQKPLIDWVVLTWNQSPFFEHPHLTPWVLASFMKAFGINTLTALMPIVLLSNLTVLLTYFLGKRLLDHRFGMLAATVLTLTPQFVKNGRNPMLEPALMFCIMLVIFFYIKSVQDKKFIPTLIAGFCFGLAFLAKGPPSVLALAVIVAFQGITRASASPSFERFKLSWRDFSVRLFCIVFVGVAVVASVDLWHYLVTGGSFFGHYISHQLKFTVLEGRGVPKNDLWFYVQIFLHYWPWLPFVAASVPLVIWKKDDSAFPALAIGVLVTLGTYLGFTLLRQKSAWYIAIYYVGSSMLAALALRYLISEKVLKKYYLRFCFGLTVPLLFLSASFPSIFTHYGRPFELFLEKSSTELNGKLEGKNVADCIGVEPWKGPFFLKFYLGVTNTSCIDSAAKFKIIDDRNYVFDRGGYRILFSQHPFSIVERID